MAGGAHFLPYPLDAKGRRGPGGQGEQQEQNEPEHLREFAINPAVPTRASSSGFLHQPDIN